MQIKEFCEKYKVSHQTVYEKLHRRENGVLSGHIKRLPKQSIDLDEFAVRELMPKSALIEEYKNRCAMLTEENAKLENRVTAQHEEIIRLRTVLTERRKRKSNLEEQTDSSK